MKFIFILGNNPELSKAEIYSVLTNVKSLAEGKDFLVVETENIEPKGLIQQLGGTIKIGRVLGETLEVPVIVEEIMTRNIGGKAKFGFSFYGVPENRKIGMEVKNALKEKDISSRLVVSKQKTLSSVIVTKEKVTDFLVFPGYLGVTEAVQDFEEYGFKDFGRPAADAKSGMLPPKLCKMMINLACLEDDDDTILDPFCGSGTVLMEAMAMGYRKVIGADISDRAYKDTLTNLAWVKDEFGLTDANYEVLSADVRQISSRVQNIQAIVTEPFLGPPMRGVPQLREAQKIAHDLLKLYVDAFKEFIKILNPGGKVVMVFPEWQVTEGRVAIKIDEEVQEMGFRRIDDNTLLYKREGQKVQRRIHIFEKV